GQIGREVSAEEHQVEIGPFIGRGVRVPRPRSDHQHRPNRRFFARPIADPPFKLLDESAHTISPSTCRAFRLLYSASDCHLVGYLSSFLPEGRTGYNVKA